MSSDGESAGRGWVQDVFGLRSSVPSRLYIPASLARDQTPRQVTGMSRTCRLQANQTRQDASNASKARTCGKPALSGTSKNVTLMHDTMLVPKAINYRRSKKLKIGARASQSHGECSMGHALVMFSLACCRMRFLVGVTRQHGGVARPSGVRKQRTRMRPYRSCASKMPGNAANMS